MRLVATSRGGGEEELIGDVDRIFSSVSLYCYRIRYLHMVRILTIY